VVNGGTIFLDEVGELPLGTQARLLRVLESGEYIRVGSSKVQKTDARVIAATNVDMFDAVKAGKFREDLYYRLNTVPLKIPPLRERKEDIHLIFRKFVADFQAKYRSPNVTLEDQAVQVLIGYPWPGNVRQLKNIAEQIAVLEKERNISGQTLASYIPNDGRSNLPMRMNQNGGKEDFSERDILYKVLFDMKKDMVELKKLVVDLISNGGNVSNYAENNPQVLNSLYEDIQMPINESKLTIQQPNNNSNNPRQQDDYHISHQDAEEVEESLSLIDKEADMIKKALKKHKGKRKAASEELGISERTLYRKIKELNLN
jgi:DNA-binding NtrC family response regulator